MNRGKYDINFNKVDDNFYNAYGVVSAPEIIIIGSGRTVLENFIGPISGSELEAMFSDSIE